jgi:uncharacterized glyoxalase superfamily protein PhnB
VLIATFNRIRGQTETGGNQLTALPPSSHLSKARAWPTGEAEPMKQPIAAVTTAVTPSSPDRPPTIWPAVPYPDPQAAIDFLVAVFGFEPTALIPGDEPGSYAEIELRWPDGSGGIIIRRSDRPAPSWLYVVTPDPDGLYDRVKAAGLEITREITDTDYGSRTFTVVDPWSVSWSFGTYPGS